LFVAVVAGLALALLARADPDGRACVSAVEIDSGHFVETVETAEYPEYFLQFSEADRLEVKGKWYHFKGDNKVVRANTCDERTTFSTFIAVYLSCDQSSEYYYDDLAHVEKCSLRFYAEQDVDYFVVIGGKRIDNETFNEGTMAVDFIQVDSPAEHACDHAIDIEIPFIGTHTTVDAEPVLDKCLESDHSGVWYHFVGTGKEVTTHTCNETTDFDTVISIFSSCDTTSSDVCVSSDDDSCGLGSSTTFHTVEGQDYFIFVSGSSNHRGVFTLSVIEAGYNPHGYCNDAIEVNTMPFTHHGSTKMIPGVHSECQGKDLRGLWYHISNVKTELIALTCDDNVGFSDTTIDVYSDCNEKTGSNCVAMNDDYCGMNAAVVIPPGDGYYIYVSGLSNSFEGQNFTLTIQNNQNKTNDRCYQGTRIHSLPVDFSGNTRDFDYETDLRCAASSGHRRGAWFSFVNRESSARIIGATTCNAENVMHSTVEVYSMCDSCLEAGQYDSSRGCSTVSFVAEPNKNYSIFVSAASGEESGFYHVDFYEDQPSSNQHCDAPTEALSLPFVATGFSGKSDPSYTSCDGNEYRGLWYLIHGTGKRIRAATVSGSTHYDSLIELHSGCPSAGGQDTCIDKNDDVSHQGLDSSLEWDSQVGVDYFVFVRGYEGATGLFTLNVYELSEPSNSQCQTAVDLDLGKSICGYTSFAGFSEGDCSDPAVLRQGIWYKIKTDEQKTITLSTCDSATEFDTDIEIYGACTDSGAAGCVEHQHDYRCTRGSIVSFSAEANKDYMVFVTGNRTDINQTGFFRLIAVTWPDPTSGSSAIPTSSTVPPTSSTVPASSTVPPTSSTVPTSSGHPGPVTPSSSSEHHMEIVEVFLVIFAIVLVAVIIFTIVCCFYKRRKHSASYYQMDVPDGLDSAQSSTYVAPNITEEDGNSVTLGKI